jgi:two-component system response regulator HydG
MIAPMAPTNAVAPRVLIIDNDADHAHTVADSLQSVGYRTTVATSGTEGLQHMRDETFDVIVTDLVMNDVDGLQILAHAKGLPQAAASAAPSADSAPLPEALQPDAEVILLTGHGTVRSAVQAMQQGAFNYLEKPLDIGQLRTVVAKACENLRLRREIAELNRRLDEKFGFQGIIGNSPRMLQVIQLLQRVAPTDARVLICGETGTGKELVAEAIHQNSPRKKKRFYPFNCASVVENVIDVELFGSVAGIYTDARDKAGVFEVCHGGTLFLDEIGDMPLPTQSKLLRVLESGEIMRIGGNDPIKVNVRVLSATNRDLLQLVEEGRFRRDLYHRLRIVEIQLPSLRERRQDIPLLVDHFIKYFAQHHGKTIKKLTNSARRRLETYDWPGNVRELKNTIEHMVVVDYDGVLDCDDLPPNLADPEQRHPEAARHDSDASGGDASLASLVGQPLEEIERRFIAETLKHTHGNREEAARLLGIGERTLYRKIDKYGF